ncbi:MAG TPA: hypothetical protein VFC07_08490 [Verrucomicrobiae bacterium]|nr:hypothetical protein [Verrucomicrobiae bacterium]
MGKPAESTKQLEEKHSINWGFVVWPLVILFLYVLSYGPILVMLDKGHLSRDNKLLQVYGPLGWAYENTPLQKPLGMYLHLWGPESFDKNGEFKVHF